MKVVLDTNTFVAAGFNSSSASALILDAVANGTLTMVWCEATRGETEHILKRIRPLADRGLMRLFESAGRLEADLDSRK